MLVDVNQGRSSFMSPFKDWSCWEIIKCEQPDECPVRKQASTPCWEVASQMDDYRSVLNICKDCLVYVSKQKDSVLTEDEIFSILQTKNDCVLVTRCPRISSLRDK